MPKKKYTDEDARRDLIALRNSCSEGLSGEWDCSTEEGRKSFEPMIEMLERVAKHYNLNIV
jgi:hypothetical protein